jgi:hypothetical protein
VVAVVNDYSIRTVVSQRFGTSWWMDRTLARPRWRALALWRRRHRRAPRGETDMQSKYPNVRIALVGEDENAFAIVERVQRALREAGVPIAEVKAFTVEACSGDYYHLLETVLRTVETT